MDYRTMQEEQRRMELFQAQSRLNSALQKLKAMQEDYRAVLCELDNRDAQHLTAYFLRNRNRYLEHQKNRIKLQEYEVEEARRNVEKHRDRRFKEWEEERGKQEEKKMDEFNMNMGTSSEE